VRMSKLGDTRAGNVEVGDFRSTLGLRVSGREQTRRASLHTRLSSFPSFSPFIPKVQAYDRRDRRVVQVQIHTGVVYGGS
jgi:hypothetical protein